jgi:hypothetical protein
MSADNVTPKDPGLEPTRFAELLIGPGVLVFAEREYIVDDCWKGIGHYSQTSLDLTYEGYQDDLLEAGVITEAMLVPPGKGSHYRDPGGRSVRISRRCRAQGGKPLQYMVVRRHMSIEELPRWPQGRQALAAYDRHAAWSAALSVFLRAGGRRMSTRGAPEPAALPRVTKPPTSLRLVIDNTRVQS